MQKEGAIRPLLELGLVFLSEEGIQQFFVLVALLGDAVAVVDGEVEEVAFGDDVLTAGFEGLQPAAVEPTADGVHGVAEELGRFPLREGIGLAAPFIGEPLTQISGRLGWVRALRGCSPPR